MSINKGKSKDFKEILEMEYYRKNEDGALEPVVQVWMTLAEKKKWDERVLTSYDVYYPVTETKTYHGVSERRSEEFAKLYKKYKGDLEKVADKMGLRQSSALVYKSAAKAYGLLEK